MGGTSFKMFVTITFRFNNSKMLLKKKKFSCFCFYSVSPAASTCFLIVCFSLNLGEMPCTNAHLFYTRLCLKISLFLRERIYYKNNWKKKKKTEKFLICFIVYTLTQNKQLLYDACVIHKKTKTHAQSVSMMSTYVCPHHHSHTYSRKILFDAGK